MSPKASLDVRFFLLVTLSFDGFLRLSALLMTFRGSVESSSSLNFKQTRNKEFSFWLVRTWIRASMVMSSPLDERCVTYSRGEERMRVTSRRGSQSYASVADILVFLKLTEASLLEMLIKNGVFLTTTKWVVRSFPLSR